jgi:putative Holliday junction resolvase
MKYMGLDMGNRTCGVSFSEGRIATAYETIRFPEKSFEACLSQLRQIITEKKVENIVMGLPKNMNGTLGPQSDYVLEFKKRLEDNFHLPVFLFDERLSTVEVTKVMVSCDLSREKRKKRVDTLAAVLILQSYLDSRR